MLEDANQTTGAPWDGQENWFYDDVVKDSWWLSWDLAE